MLDNHQHHPLPECFSPKVTPNLSLVPLLPAPYPTRLLTHPTFWDMSQLESQYVIPGTFPHGTLSHVSLCKSESCTRKQNCGVLAPWEEGVGWRGFRGLARKSRGMSNSVGLDLRSNSILS